MPADEDAPTSPLRASAHRGSVPYSSLLRNPRFAPYLSAQILAQSSLLVLSVAIIWLVYKSTGSILLLAAVVSADLAVPVILSPLAGVLVDRWDRRRTLVAVYVLDGVAATLLVLVAGPGNAYYPAVLAISVALGIGETFALPAWGGLLPRIVTSDELAGSNALLSSAGSVNTVAGYGLGGIAIALFGVEPPIAYGFIAFFAAAAVLLTLKPGHEDSRHRTRDSDRPPAGFCSDLVEGFRYIGGTPLLLQLLLVGTMVGLLANGLQVLWAPYAGTTLDGGAATYGLIIAASSAGSFFGSLLLGRALVRTRVGKFLIAGLLGQGASVAFLGVLRGRAYIPLALVGKFSIGGFQSMASVPFQSLLQARVENRLFGRVSGLMNAAFSATGPFAVLLTALIVTRVSIGMVLVAYGLGLILLVSVLSARFRAFRGAAY